VRVFHGTATECASCHVDPHGGRFDAVGREGCAHCHDERAFAPVTGAFDHARWTGFDLAGAHRGVACAMCHREPSPARLGAVPGTTCASCHVDPHAGQFATAGGTDCRRCHDAAAWTPPRFDHAESRFPLDDVHGRLACGACHKPYAVPGGSIVRYKPLGTTCGDCHRTGGEGGGRR
jgi:hypothetical protein